MGKRERICYLSGRGLHACTRGGGAQEMAARRGQRSSRYGGGTPVRLRGESSSLSQSMIPLTGVLLYVFSLFSTHSRAQFHSLPASIYLSHLAFSVSR
jgi:hypothetical protein